MGILALGFVILAQEGIDDLVRGLSDDDPSGRDRSARLIVERWERWSEADLARLRAASEGSDADLAERARTALGRVALRREMGAALLAAEPELERIARAGAVRERLELLVRIGQLWQAGKIEEPRVRRLAERAAREGWFPDFDELQKGVFARWAPSLRPLAPLLAALLRDPDGGDRQAALSLLGKIGAREYAGDVARLLDDPEEAVGAEALGTLNRLLAVDQFPKIAPLLAKARLREPAAAVLAQTAARPLAGELRPLLESPDPATRGAAAAVLGGMGAHEHAGAVAALLGSDDAALVLKAAGALGRMGAAAEAPRVAALLKHDDPFVRVTAAQSLGRMRDRRWGASLLPLLRDPVTDVRDAASWALGEILPEDRVEEVSGLLVDRDASVRGLSARALGQAGVRGRAKDITRVLDWEHPWSRTRAIRALGGMGAAEHLDAIIKLVLDEWDVVRISSAAALCELSTLPWPDGKKDAAIANLRQLRQDLGEEVQHAGTAALVVLEGGGLPAQREALEVLDERDTETIPVLLDALARVHERKGREALDREIEVEKAVDSIERLKEELAKAGLALEESDDPRVVGRIPGGFRTTPRRLLATLWEGTLAVPQGPRVRVLYPMHAVQHWKDQLRSR
jgi:HEAT repeat protein